MKDFNGKISYKDEEYTLVFNLNVMETIQEEYGSVAKWGDMVYNADEPKIKPLVFALWQMINEGIEIENEDHNGNRPLISRRMAGRIASEIGIEKAASAIGDVVVDSSKSEDDGKNE